MSEEQQAVNMETYCSQLRELQTVDFALLELNLYLNTHPGDMQAIQQFNQLAQKRQAMAQQFELQYGPLVITATATPDFRGSGARRLGPGRFRQAVREGAAGGCSYGRQAYIYESGVEVCGSMRKSCNTRFE